MRPALLFRVSALTMLASPLVCAPLMAEDASDIVFVSGTGQVMSDNTVQPVRDSLADSHDAQADMNDIGDKMADPRMQDSVAHMIEGMTDTMMHLPVGKMAQAVERARPGTLHKRIRNDATLGDIAGRDARDLPETLGDKSRDMMGMMGGFAKAFAVMLPEFEKMGKQMEASFNEAGFDRPKVSRRY
jgi:hypothetical protein